MKNNHTKVCFPTLKNHRAKLFFFVTKYFHTMRSNKQFWSKIGLKWTENRPKVYIGLICRLIFFFLNLNKFEPRPLQVCWCLNVTSQLINAVAWSPNGQKIRCSYVKNPEITSFSCFLAGSSDLNVPNICPYLTKYSSALQKPFTDVFLLLMRSCWYR